MTPPAATVHVVTAPVTAAPAAAADVHAAVAARAPASASDPVLTVDSASKTSQLKALNDETQKIQIAAPAKARAPSSVGTTEATTPSAALATRENIKSSFQGVTSLEDKNKGMLLKAERRLSADVAQEMGAEEGKLIGIVYGATTRKVAAAQGRLFEDTPVSQLKPGTYTYVITQDGKATYGRVEDTWEVGVKHAQLANGRKILSAGEVKVDPDGEISYNLASGTYMVGVDDSARRLATGKFFAAEAPGRSVRMTSSQTSMLPRNSPDLKTVRGYCAQPAFKQLNSGICHLVGG
jgi:hypothetical protein